MKIKIYNLLLAATILFASVYQANATTVTVNVLGSSFSPTDFTINNGDTVMWLWNNNAGNHTTTSTIIPSGANPWDELINHNATMFMYVPVVAGSYDYECTFHASMGMVGHFTVIGSTGIVADATKPVLQLLAASPATGELHMQYEIPNTTKLTIVLYDIIGNKVKTLLSDFQNAGTYSLTSEVLNLHSGIYMARLETSDNVVSQRVIIQ